MPRRLPRLPHTNLGDLSSPDPGFTEASVTPREDFANRPRLATADRPACTADLRRSAPPSFDAVAVTHLSSGRIHAAGSRPTPAPRLVGTRLGSCCEGTERFFGDLMHPRGAYPCVRVAWTGHRKDASYEVRRTVTNADGLELASQPLPWKGGSACLDGWLPHPDGFRKIVYRVRASDARGYSAWTEGTFRTPSYDNARRYHRLVLSKVVEGKRIAGGRSFTPMDQPFVPPAAEEVDGFRRLISGGDVHASRAAMDRLVLAAA